MRFWEQFSNLISGGAGWREEGSGKSLAILFLPSRAIIIIIVPELALPARSNLVGLVAISTVYIAPNYSSDQLWRQETLGPNKAGSCCKLPGVV